MISFEIIDGVCAVTTAMCGLISICTGRGSETAGGMEEDDLEIEGTAGVIAVMGIVAVFPYRSPRSLSDVKGKGKKEK